MDDVKTVGDTTRPELHISADDEGERSFYSISQAAALLGVSRVTIWRWIRAGQLPVLRLGHRTVRITPQGMEQVLARGAVEGMRRGIPPAESGLVTGNGSVHTDGADRREPDHIVQFYQADEALLEGVVGFIGAALSDGNAGVIIATEDHRAAVEARLRASGLDLDAARATGRYLSLNATETLSRISVDGDPDPARFAEVVGDLIARAAKSERGVRIFGEMVALLMDKGDHAAAVRLEDLWNARQQVDDFSLMCGYPMDGFGAEALTEVFEDICAEHNRVIPAESYTALKEPDDRLRAIADLQQKARSLEAQIAQRERAEERLEAALVSERRAAQRMQRLQEITGQLSQSLQTDDVLANIARSAADLLQAPVGAVFLLDQSEPDEDFILAAAHGIDTAHLPDLRLPRRASLAGRAIDEGRTLVVDDVSKTPGTALPALLTGETTGSEIAAPITAGKVQLGVVKAFSPTVQRFSEDDAGLLTTLAAAAAVALTNARLYREAQAAVKARDEFLSIAAHDLKTPLTSIKGMSQILRRVVSSQMPDDQRLVEGLESIDATATKMGHQVDELLDMARLQVGHHLELRRLPTDLVELTRRVVAEQQQVTDRHRIHLETSLDEMVGRWDAPRLGRVLENLLSNAVKYTPAGGDITVTVSREESDKNEWAVVAVEDHGMGVPAADLAGIFDRFRRATNAVGRIGGTGIGLASARQIVEQHGGTIAVESVEGLGSTFTVRLPLA